jgi:hypothetical protein
VRWNRSSKDATPPAEHDAERAIFHNAERDAMTTEISTQPAGGLALQSFDDAYRFAKMVAASDFAPKDFKNKPESCLLAIQHGSEVGLSPMQSLQSIACINGRPSVWGDAALALVMGSPVCEHVRESIEGDGDSMVATCQAKRRGYENPTVARFSVADAKKAGLWGKAGPWTQYPKRMLQLRARGFALRDAFPDVLKGLVTAEEAQDYEPAREPVVIRPKLEGVVKPADPPKTAEDPMGKARLAVSKADTIDGLDTLRRLVDRRLGEGIFTPAEHDELVALMRHRAEMLIESSDSGTDFAHEAAEHEVTA